MLISDPAMAASGSVVGLPSLSSAHPSGMRSPAAFAIVILPRATVVVD